MTDDDRSAPPPLGEGRRRAYLEAMGIPVWIPRAEADAAAAEAARASREPAATPDAEAPEAASGPEPADEPPPIPADVADTMAAQSDALAGEDEPERAVAATPDVASLGWGDLRERILGCTGCTLCESRTQAVPGVGARAAELLVIGEAPGQEEDRRGEPFVGRAGQLLDRMLAGIGLDRETVFITNVLKCRPPKNRDPKPEEVRACAPYLRRQIELISPRVILSVGRVSAQSLLETSAPIGRLRGHWHEFGPQQTPLLVTYHPAYLLRSPLEKRKAWADLKAVRARLSERTS